MANVIKHKRGSGSDPVASDLVVGEVAIRTDVGKLFTKMDNGSVAEIAGGGSDIAINTLSSSSGTGGGSATFNGSAYRFTLSAPPSVSAQQLLVSINGVIQKPVAGTGQPSEGFSVDGTDIILGDAPATGSDFFILTFKSLGVSEPADNSVTSAKIVDGAIVNADINASAAIAGTKISPDFGSQDVVTTGNITSGGTLKTTGNVLTVEGATPRLNLTDTNNNSDFEIGNTNGTLNIADSTNSVNRLRVLSNGTVIVTGNLDAEGGIDVTGAITGTGDLTIDTNTLHVDSSNNRVGIGTTSPLNTFHVHGDGTLRISNSAGVNQFESGRLRFTENTSDFQGAYIHYDGNSNIFHIGTHAANDTVVGNDLNAISIPRGSGNVGIGTTSPSDNLDIASTVPTLRLTDTDGGPSYHQIKGPGNGDLRISCDVGNTSSGDSEIQFDIHDSNKMVIQSTGNVGIGTTSPSSFDNSADDLVISTSGNTGITINSGSAGSTSEGNLVFAEGTAGSQDKFRGAIQYKHGEDRFSFYTNNSERVRIESSGRVIVKTSGINLENATATNSRTYSITNAAGTTGWTFGNGVIASAHQFVIYDNTAGAARMLIDSSGNVHIGKTASDFAIEGFSFRNLGSGAFVLQGVRDGSGGAVIECNRQTNVGRQIEFYRGSSNLVGHIECNNTSTAYNTSGSDRTLKKNFESWNENVLDLFKGINPQKFNFIQEDDGTKKSKGFVAQDMVSSFPEAYTKGEEEDSKYFFNPSGMVVYLMKALQEAVARIEVLEAK